MNDTKELQGLVKGLGCAMLVGRFVITLPIWYILLYCLLASTAQPTWIWVLYWVYLPSGVLLAMGEAAFSAVAKELD